MKWAFQTACTARKLDIQWKSRGEATIRGRALLVLLRVVVALQLFAMTGCFSQTPPLLENVTAGTGGLEVICPSDGKDKDSSRPASGSPELNQRLAADFPVGSDEGKLVKALTAQKFKIGTYTGAAVCADDKAVRMARFVGSMEASIYWKADAQHRVLWTKGFVHF